jgi:hypothetical protein
MSSTSKHPSKKVLIPIPLIAAPLVVGLGNSSVSVEQVPGVGHNAVIPEVQTYHDSMTIYLREVLTDNKEN